VGDPFLDVTNVSSEKSAMSNAIQAALQRNKTYSNGSDYGQRVAFRAEWAQSIRDESKHYTQPISDVQHCEAIQRISDRLRGGFGPHLSGGHLRYGTSQKALNLYLKFLWRLGKATIPPHCPVDRVVLAAGGIEGAWTKCDSDTLYMGWIDRLRIKAKLLTLAEWEYDLWYHDWLRKQRSPADPLA
jgi:hypothetical protein